MTRDSVIHAYTTMRRQSFLSAYEYNCGCDDMPDSVFAYVISAWYVSDSLFINEVS